MTDEAKEKAKEKGAEVGLRLFDEERKDFATVTLAGQEYTVKRLPLRKAAKWREEFDTIVAGIANKVSGTHWQGNIEDVVADLMANGAGLLLYTDEIINMLQQYPEIGADAERIDKELDDYEELIIAFVEVVKLTFPLAKLREMANSVLKPKPNPESNSNGSEAEPQS